ncbi:MAG: hypothetical protein ABIN48_03040 [Ginsengibacter sp.]
MKIEFNQEWYANAICEQQLRAPYMMTKFVDNEARKAGQIRGLVIEHHVSGWFKLTYPNHYLEPDNYQHWAEVCSHDFKIKRKSGLLYIDISGPKRDGTFGSYNLKPKDGVDFHLLCHALGFKTWQNVDYKKGFQIMGAVRSKNYHTTIKEEDIIDIQTWLKYICI